MDDENRVVAVGVLRRLFLKSHDEAVAQVKFLQPEELERLAKLAFQIEQLKSEACEVLDSIGDRQLQDLATAET